MEFRVPELGEGVYEAELVEWLVRPGHRVRRGEHLAEVMTDKATMELPAPFSGTDRCIARPTRRDHRDRPAAPAILHADSADGI